MYNNSWVQTILGLYKYKFKVNPEINITIYINNGNDTFGTITVDNVLAYPENDYPNRIIYDNVEIYNNNILQNPDDEDIGRTLFLTSPSNNGAIVEVNNVVVNGGSQSNEWISYNISPISILNMLDGSQNILHYNENDYTISQDIIFTGLIVDILPNIENYNLGDTFLLINNNNIDSGKVYEISYRNDSINKPYELKELYSSDCYFIDINNCKNYIVNYNEQYSYIIEKPESNYFVGHIIAENIVDYIEGEYYSLNISSPFNIDNRIFNFGDICIFKDGELNKLLINNEGYEIYNKEDGDYENNNKLNKTYTFINNYYGLNEYKSYNYQSNDLTSQPITGYKVMRVWARSILQSKINSFILSYNNLNIGGDVSVYLKLIGNYKQIKLLDKTIIKNFDGKQYLIEAGDDKLYGKIIDIIKPGIKLDNTIANKYIGDDYVDKNLNLFKSSSRLFTQIINNNSLLFEMFNPQPPINLLCKSNCIVVIKNNDLKWIFETKNINDESIIFEYCINGINYDLIYNIKREKVKEVILSSTKFNGYIKKND